MKKRETLAEYKLRVKKAFPRGWSTSNGSARPAESGAGAARTWYRQDADADTSLMQRAGLKQLNERDEPISPDRRVREVLPPAVQQALPRDRAARAPEPLNAHALEAQQKRIAGWAWSHRGSKEYQQADRNDRVGGYRRFITGGSGDPKCNIFVGDGLEQAGIRVRDPANPDLYPLARHWYDPNVQLEGFRVLGPEETPQPGDIVADEDHMGIFFFGPNGENRTISAASPTDDNPKLTNSVVHNDWGFRPGQRVTIRRYVGPQ